MLIITRRAGEKLMIGDDVVVTVMECTGSSVRLGIAAPRSTPVYREEIWAAVKAENEASAQAGEPAAEPTASRTPSTPEAG